MSTRPSDLRRKIAVTGAEPHLANGVGTRGASTSAKDVDKERRVR